MPFIHHKNNQLPMPEQTLQKENYLKLLLKFYFTPRWQAVFTILFLLATVYLVIFFIGNLWIVFLFFITTLTDASTKMTLTHLLWGLIFEITLLIPFFLSVYSILLLHKLWRLKFSKNERLFVTLLMIIGLPMVIFITYHITQIAAEQAEIQPFVIEHNLEKFQTQ